MLLLRRAVVLLHLVMVVMCSRVCIADDCGPATYAYENRVVFYSCDKAGLGLNVVILGDGTDLKIAGRVAVTARRGYDAIAHHRNHLMILTWDHLDIFDVADPAHPILAVSFPMKKQGSFRGYDRIEKNSEDTFLVLSSLGAGELAMAGDPPKWTYKDIARTPAHDKMMGEWPPESRFSREIDNFVSVLETANFRYELVWKDKTRPGGARHRQYLRKVDKATQRTVSALLLGGNLETID